MKKLIIAYAITLISTFSFSQTVIKMENKNGVYYVPCTVNGLKLKFIFDTGASDVSISLSEAIFMIKNDYMKEEDLKGTEYYNIANGDIAEGTKIIIRKLEIGGLVLYDVEASIVHTLSAPLLLGQSAIRKFGTFSIDYSNNTLTIRGNTVGAANEIPNISNTQMGSTFIDTRDNKSYKTVRIGTQTWMAENLNYTTNNGSLCYDNNKSYCIKYGRLYDFETALIVCPTGWHLPSMEEWNTLTLYVGSNAEAVLKSTKGWANDVGTDSYGFSALPGAGRRSNWSFTQVGKIGSWWSSSEAYIFHILDIPERNSFRDITSDYYGSSETSYFSVRCLKDK